MIDSERRLFGTNFEENFRNADADNVLRAIYKYLITWLRSCKNI